MTQQVTYLRTDTVPIAKLRPYPGNAKRGDVGAILASLRRNSQYRSLVVRETAKGRLTVLAGNHTMQALAAHGPGPCGVTLVVAGVEQPCGVCGGQDWKPAARCEVIACDDEAARRINLADNKTADLGSYDDKALLELVSALDGDYDGSGYADSDLEDLLKVTGALAEETTAFLTAFTTPAETPTPAAVPGPASPAAAVPPAVAAPFAPADATAAAGTPTADQTSSGPADPTPPAAAYSSVPAAGPAAMPAPQTTVPIQWVVTLVQRDTIRAAIKHAQTAGGFDTAAEALTHICHTHLTTQGASQ